MSRHRLSDASAVEATVELAATARSGRAGRRRARESEDLVAPAAPPATASEGEAGRARHVLNTDTAPSADHLDRAALAKEILAAVDDRISMSDDVRGGHEPTDSANLTDSANPTPPPGRRQRRTSGAHTRRRDGRAGHRRGARRGRTMLLIAGVAAGLVAVPAVGMASAGPCRWQQAAHQLIVALDGHTDDRSAMVRNALTQAGVGPQVSAGCAQTAAAPAVGPTDVAATTDDLTADDKAVARRPSAPQATPAPASKPTALAPPPTPARPTTSPPAPQAPVAGTGTDSGPTAAAAFGWGTPVKSDDFTGDLSQWGLYDGPGHAGNGRRSPSAATVANGILTIAGDANGTTDGMAWGTGQKYGRWEGRVRAPASDPTYNALLLLWPDAENYPVGGEIDFMEMTDNTRQSTNLFLHYGADDSQVHGEVRIDATQWHNWAVEWTPKGVTTYVDGKPWWHTDDTSILPPGPMHLCVQLDWFPEDGHGAVVPSQMQVDWVRQYAV